MFSRTSDRVGKSPHPPSLHTGKSTRTDNVERGACEGVTGLSHCGSGLEVPEKAEPFPLALVFICYNNALL